MYSNKRNQINDSIKTLYPFTNAIKTWTRWNTVFLTIIFTYYVSVILLKNEKHCFGSILFVIFIKTLKILQLDYIYSNNMTITFLVIVSFNKN